MGVEVDFDRVIDRRQSGSLKWDLFGESGTLPFWVADMDFASPPEVIAALEARVEHGVFGYGWPTGEHVDAVVDHVGRRHGVRIERDWIVWLPGLVPGLSVACRASGEDGDNVLTPRPIYPPFLKAPGDARMEVRAVDAVAGEDGRYTLDREGFERAIDSRSRLLLLSNPYNPVGRVFSREEIDGVVDFCCRHDLWLCSDEVHCDLIFDEERTPHVSALDYLERAGDRLVVLMAASKTYNLAGLSCAYALVPDPAVRRRFRRAMGGWIPPVGALGLDATAAAYRHGEPWRRALLAYLAANRDHLCREVAARVPGIGVIPPEATYLAWMDVSRLGLEQPALHFRRYGLALSAGGDFGDDRFLRWNFGCPRSLLRRGLDRLERGVRAWQEGGHG